MAKYRSRRKRKKKNQKLWIYGGIALVVAVSILLLNAYFNPGGIAQFLDRNLEVVTTDSGLQYQDTLVGTGDVVQDGQILSVHYSGYLEDGTQFDSSVERDVPFELILGNNSVIAGWEEGLQGMRVGGIRVLIIPSELGYGPTGSGEVIPPDATLIFEVEVLSAVTRQNLTQEFLDPDLEVITTESGLQYQDTVIGSGEEVQAGYLILVHYSGYLQDGSLFDSSYERDIPFELIIGIGRLIPGWEEGIEGMNEGGRRVLIIPSEIAYGATGAGNVIPPNETLIFEVEVLSIHEKMDQTIEVGQSVSGVAFQDLIVGEGDIAEIGDTVVVHYTGWLTDGYQFDSSVDRDQTFEFTIGVGSVIPGWDEGVQGMAVGGTRYLFIPPDLAYGSQGAGGAIPPNAILIFEVQLMEIIEPTE